jgi:amidohydrolase family protein
MRGPLTIVLLLTSLASGQWNPWHSPQELVITNINVIDTVEGTVIPNRTVVIRGDRIIAIAKFGIIDANRKIQVVNGTGKYLIPGLWDMHVHNGDMADQWDDSVLYPLYIANGVTGVRDLSRDPDGFKRRQERIEHGDLVGPHLVSGPSLTKTASNHFRNISDFEEQRALNVVAATNVKAVSLRAPLSRMAFLDSPGILQTSHREAVSSNVSRERMPSFWNEDSASHLTDSLIACSSQETELREERAETASNHDLEGYWAVGMKAFASYDPNKAWNHFVDISNSNIWQVPALVWTQATANIDRSGLSGDPRLLYVPRQLREEWEPQKLLQQTDPKRLADLKTEAARSLDLVKAMHRAGVQFLAGTNSPEPYVFPGFSLHDELELLVKGGLTPLQALQAATFNPALFLVKLDQYGIVQEKHVADLVLLNDNPLQDIRNTRKIFAVVAAGKFYSREDLNKMLGKVQQAADKK